jgi:PIN domain nuclease of toxin-antitoxin system
MLNLDTHVLVALLDGSVAPAEERIILVEELAISDIVLWEISKLVQLGRLKLDLESDRFREGLGALIVFPITLEIARVSTALDFSSDPADEIIAATSVVEGAPLLTRDRKILRSRIVPLAKL